MTKPISDNQPRKRRRKKKLSTAPGTVWGIVPQYAAELRYSARFVKNIRMALREFLEILERDPEPRDFLADNLDALRVAMETRSSAHDYVMNTLQILRRLWLWLANRGLAEMPPQLYRPRGKPGNPFGHVWNPDAKGTPIKASAKAGSLWEICQKLYFPRRTKLNSKATRQHYFFAICRLKEILGREPVITDLNDDNIAALMRFRQDQGRAPETINKEAGRLRTLWTWLAKKRMINEFPTPEKLKEPKRVPKAWTRDELNQLIEACRQAPGLITGKPASDWFVAVIHVIWDAKGERIGAVLSIRREWIDWKTGEMLIPAEFRKGKERDMACLLHADTLDMLRRLADDGRDLIFGDIEITDIYRRFKAIRHAGGLPTDRKSAFHRIRKTLASYMHLAGYNATDTMGHSSDTITRNAYLDPRIVGSVHPADVLFRPGNKQFDEASPPPVVPSSPKAPVAPAATDVPLDALAWL